MPRRRSTRPEAHTPIAITASAVAATASGPYGRTSRYSGIVPIVPACPGATGTCPQPNHTPMTCATLSRQPANGAGAGLVAPEPVALDDIEHLAQDLDAVPRRRLIDGQRRLDPEAGGVRHRQQTAPHRLGEDALRHPARQRLLRLLVLHQLHPDQETRAVDEADERVAIDERLELALQHLADDARVVDQLLLVDDLQRRRAR